MPSSFPMVRLQDICERITVGFVGPMAHRYVPQGVPFLRSQNIHPFRLELSDVKFVSDEFHRSIIKSALRPGDVGIVRTGYPGTACVIPTGFGEGNCADLVVVTPSSRLNPYFLAATFNSAWGRGTVAGNLVGAAQQHFNVGAAKEMLVPCPHRAEQDRIAGILSAYDDLIENCQRRIRILEDIARSLYREWFVHFRYPGTEAVPLVESALGLIPSNWTALPVKEIAEVIYGFPFKSQAFNANGVGRPVVRIRDIPMGASATYTDEVAEAKYDIDNGDILIGMDGDFHMCIWSGGAAVQNQRVAKFRPRPAIGIGHLFFALEAPIQQLNRSIVGTTVAHLGDAHIKLLQLILPPEVIRKRADSVLEPAWRQVVALRGKVANLRRTRDLLLPRLLSGQLHVEVAAEHLKDHCGSVAVAAGAPPSLESVTSFTTATETFEPVADREAPAPDIDSLDRTDILRAIRTLFDDNRPRERDDAIRALARALGYRRTGPRIAEALHGHQDLAGLDHRLRDGGESRRRRWMKRRRCASTWAASKCRSSRSW